MTEAQAHDICAPLGQAIEQVAQAIGGDAWACLNRARVSALVAVVKIDAAMAATQKEHAT